MAQIYDVFKFCSNHGSPLNNRSIVEWVSNIKRLCSSFLDSIPRENSFDEIENVNSRFAFDLAFGRI